MKQSEFLATCSKRGENHLQGANGFDFASHRKKNLGEIFKPITKSINRNCVTVLFSVI